MHAPLFVSVQISKIRIQFFARGHDFKNTDLSDLTLQTYTQKDEHAPKGQEEPSPGQSEYNERHPGYRTTHIPCALKVAAGNIGGFIRIYISNVSSCPCRARTIRIHLTQGAAPRCFALPWAGFLLGLQPVHVPSVVLIVRVFINHIPRTGKCIWKSTPRRFFISTNQ